MRLDKKTRIDAMFSGTTTVVLFFDENCILSANSGDSRAIMVSQGKSSNSPYKDQNNKN